MGRKGKDMSTQTQEPTHSEIPLHQNSDWFLQSLVSIANSGPLEFGITLQVGGFLVSGSLVNGATYFEGFAAQFASTFPKEFAKDMQDAIGSHGAVYKKPREEEDSPLLQPTFIHLKGARFFNNSGKPIPIDKEGVWWRGRLSEVSGFVFGSLSQD